MVRIGNGTRNFFKKGIFNKKITTPDDSVKNEEKEALLAEPSTDNQNTHSVITDVNTEKEFIEFGEKISPYLTTFRKILEEGKLAPNSRTWVEPALNTLVKCIEIASQNKRYDLHQLFLEIARIIYSSDRVGKSYLSIEPVLELYSLLCCVVADFLRGKPNKPIIEQWNKYHQKIIDDLLNAGVRLVDDNEEPITKSTSEPEPIVSQEFSGSPSTTLEEIPTPAQDINTSLSQDTISSPSEEDFMPPIPSTTSEDSDTETTTENIYPEQTIHPTDTVDKQLSSETTTSSVENITHITSEEVTSSVSTQTSQSLEPPISEPSNEIPSIEKESSLPGTETTIPSPIETINLDDFIYKIKEIPQKEIREILLDTLQAIVQGTPETAKIKAVELAREMAKLEIEKIKMECGKTECQIENLSSEISSFEEEFNRYQKEIQSIEEELKEQQNLIQKTEKDKAELESTIENIQHAIEEIERKIAELQQQKEMEIAQLNEYQEKFKQTEKNIEEINKAILSLKEKKHDHENRTTTLIHRIASFEKTKNEKEEMLQQLKTKIKEKESIVRRLEETLYAFRSTLHNPSEDNTFTLKKTTIENTIDLFDEGI